MKEYIIHGKPELKGALRQAEIPTPGSREVLIKVMAAGLNPKDWKFVQGRSESEAFNAGDDVAGIIEAVGPEVFEYKPGDRVAAFHRMGQPAGTYAEYTVTPASTTFPLPPNISFEAGAGILLSFITAALALYHAVGSYALQLAKLSKLNPIITVAGSGIDHVKSLDAATHIVDYRKGNVADEILNALKVLQASGGGHINMVDPPTDGSWSVPSDVKLTRTFVSSAYGVKHSCIDDEQAKADEDFAYLFYRYLSLLLANGKFKPHSVEVLPGGLNHIIDGVKALYDGKVSAKKLVARVSEE